MGWFPDLFWLAGEILLLLEHSTGSQIVEMTPVASEASDDAG